MRGRGWRRTWRGGALVGAALLSVGLYLGWLQLTGNIHAVVQGEVYRSAQPDGETLERLVRLYGIRSVVNLRGAESHADWYRDEIATAARLGLEHVDYRMKADRDVPPEEAQRIIALLRDLPKPLLIHCKSGSDRTGLVSALYLAGVTGADEDSAEDQLSIYYGHIGVPVLSAAWPMDRSWEAVEHLFGFDS
ncbi:dual specificity protein phosphatase family protein [Frigidibacter sp. MR17.24]|uniref:dual specificity protein phosphatase family protein n=1 Tax=Frigidibacter sp. MR17.24 TaxID=3127345 RepID=UPI003012E52D